MSPTGWYFLWRGEHGQGKLLSKEGGSAVAAPLVCLFNWTVGLLKNTVLVYFIGLWLLKNYCSCLFNWIVGLLKNSFLVYLIGLLAYFF